MQAGLLFGHEPHYLDHIAPLCSFLNIPLFVTEEVPTEYYPNLVVKQFSPEKITEEILRQSDVLFTCLPRQLVDPLFFFDEMKLRKKLLTCWLPHGNSDKENLGALTMEKILLIYGKQMLERLPKGKERTISIGNLRAHFYKTHERFYHNLLGERLQFKREGKTLFYAPTWDETSVKYDLPYLLDHLPEGYNLFVKLHPNTLERGYLPHFEDRPNVKFLDEIPTIYPILARSDVYIGDHSSIAYDFLSFDRPLFFLSKKKTAIHLTGRTVEVESLFEALKERDNFHEARKDLYQYAFESVDYSTLKETIAATIQDYFDTEIHGL